MTSLSWTHDSRYGRSALCRDLRSRGNTTPIIILSAKDSTDDRIMGLSEGADDYIVKPFSLAELLLRIQAVLRRSSTPEEKVLQVGNLRLELDSKRVFRGDTELKLNPTAFRILAFLMQKSPEVVSREELRMRSGASSEWPGII